MSGFQIKDSGERTQFESGMVRDVTEGKIDFTLALDGPMFKRWAIHLTKGAVKYARRNWMKARGVAELERFKESALRHFLQWYWGDTDEDHAAAVLFNINGAEYVKEHLQRMEDSRNVHAVAQLLRVMSDECSRVSNNYAVERIPGVCPSLSPDPCPLACERAEGHSGLHEAPEFTEAWCD